MPTSPGRGKSHSGGGTRGSRPTGCMCPGGQGRPPCWNIYRYPCGRAPMHPPWQRAASRDSASRKAVEAQSFEPGKTGKSVARGTGQREITADAREEVLKRSFKRRFWGLLSLLTKVTRRRQKKRGFRACGRGGRQGRSGHAGWTGSSAPTRDVADAVPYKSPTRSKTRETAARLSPSCYMGI